MSIERIAAELALLREGGIEAVHFPEQQLVLYHNVPTAGERLSLPGTSSVVVPVPGGYPATAIDLAGLPVGSPLIGRARGNPNGPVVAAGGQSFQLISFHPFGNEGGVWDPSRQGFHTYYMWVRTWLSYLN